ncbi:MAG: low-specificity L-threonine aldolase [Dehalococcoidales bacterium]|nr:MAG: low-specificity L-threonine aldolase [Dehalococcoidales bacterium]
MKIVDLRSDTITLPTDEMRLAMYQAEVGDDVYREDPTINSLEQLAAQMLGKEAALFTTSGTMSNLLAILAQTHHGDEVLLGSESHTFWYEVGGASALGGVVMHTIPNSHDGQMDFDIIEDSIRSQNISFPQTTLLCLENTHNRCGGAVLTANYTSDAAEIAHRHGLRVHLDGARIFNAAIALDISASELVSDVDSICLCLSKGLSAPVGSLLCGTEEFIEGARKWRKMIGGGMRQAGVIAAAGIVALQTMVGRLAEDHDNARHLAKGLSNIPGIIVPHEVQTNIVNFETSLKVSGSEFIQMMNTRGVKVGYRGDNKYRAVTSRMVISDDIDEALYRIDLGLREVH